MKFSTRRTATVLAAALLVIPATACSLASSKGSTAHRSSTEGRTSDESDRARADRLAALRTDFRREVAGMRPIAVDLTSLPEAPAGFDAYDVRTLAAVAQGLLRNSVDPELSKKPPLAAVRHVFAGQYAATTGSYISWAIDRSNGFNWEWEAADRYAPAPARPAEVVRLRWKAETVPGHWSDGSAHDYLKVTLQALTLARVHTETGVQPIVVRRTITVSSYRPGGGPEWWPAVGITAMPYGNEGCTLVTRNRLVPMNRLTGLREDLAALRVALDTPGVADTSSEGEYTSGSVGKVRHWCQRRGS